MAEVKQRPMSSFALDEIAKRLCLWFLDMNDASVKGLTVQWHIKIKLNLGESFHETSEKNCEKTAFAGPLVHYM